MKKKETITTVFAIVFFLLFTISAAVRPLSENDVVFTSTKSSDLINNDHRGIAIAEPTVEPETTTQTLIVHPIKLSRSNQINRRFYNHQTHSIPFRFVRRHPCRNYFLRDLPAVHNTNPSGNDVVLASGDHVPSKWLQFKHHPLHFEAELEIDGENLQIHHHHQQKGAVGFMRSIRKFLKHAFD